jgi:hypothetical protein
MRIIREKVFSTPSSSTHAISIMTEEKVLDYIMPDENGVVTIKGLEFGWGPERYNQALDKLSYLFLDIETHENKEWRKEKTKLLKETIKKQTGAYKVVFKKDEGYIDHQSHGTSIHVLKSEKSIKDFVFNLNTWLFITNDNEDAPSSLYNVEIYEKDKIVYPKYKYELRVEGIDERILFTEYPRVETLDREIRQLIPEYSYLNEYNEWESDGLYVNDKEIYLLDHRLKQDYNNGEILLVLNDSKFRDIYLDVIRLQILDYEEKQILIRMKAKAANIIKPIKFEVIKINGETNSIQ